SNDIVLDVHHTVKLCRDLNLVQQAYTFLQENIISYLCSKGKINLLDRNYRSSIPQIISHHSFKRTRLSENLSELNDLLKPYVTTDLANLYIKIGNYRNDLNHAGYREGAKKYDTFSKELDNFISDFERIVFDTNNSHE